MDFVAPDHFIDLTDIKSAKIDFEKEADQLQQILNTATKENDIQHYIKHNKKWFIPASLLKDYDFGHHSAYLVPEQSLGVEYRADYMLLGHNSCTVLYIFAAGKSWNTLHLSWLQSIVRSPICTSLAKTLS